MSKTNRIDKILSIIQSSDHAVSGSELAKRVKVSRQVIVQDIALLRARNIEIVSTHKGYIINKNFVQREIKVCHESSKMEDELNLIVDLGGKVENVFVEHDIYGKLEARLDISSRRDVKMFMDKINGKESKPLTDLTSGHHSHMISAENNEILDEIELELKKLSILDGKS